MNINDTKVKPLTAPKSLRVRNWIRSTVPVLLLITFPAYFYYLSPVVPVEAASRGIISGSLFVFVGLFLFSFLLGRAFCAYVCPMGCVQDMIAQAQTKPFPKKALGWTKYLLWFSWILVLAFFFRTAGGVKSVQVGFRTLSGFSVSDVPSLIVYLFVGFTFWGLAAAFGKRASCHLICWIAPFMVLGTMAARGLKIPQIHIRANPERPCSACHRCDAVCPMSIRVSTAVRKGHIASADCILCGKCVDACSRNTLELVWKTIA